MTCPIDFDLDPEEEEREPKEGEILGQMHNQATDEWFDVVWEGGRAVAKKKPPPEME